MVVNHLLQDASKAVASRIEHDPVWMVSNIFGKHLWSKEREIIQSVDDNYRTTVRGCHGFGKSFTAGNTALEFLFRHKNSIVLTTAPTFRQVEKLIWKEIRESYKSSCLPLGGILYAGKPELQIVKDEWYAMGIATANSDSFQGFHESYLLVIVDEAAGVPDEIFESIEGIITTEGSRLLLVGNPTSTSGTFKDSFSQAAYHKIHVSAYDTPNFVALGITEEDVASGKWEDKWEASGHKLVCDKLVTPEWVADKYVRWGPYSTLYKTRVLGEFDDSASDMLIPLSWIEAANERWQDAEYGADTELGADIAEYGRDNTVVAALSGYKLRPLQTYNKQKTMETAGKIIRLYNALGASVVKIDTIGVGTGVEGRIEEQGYNTIRVNVAENPAGGEEEKKKFINKRAQLYWNLREMLNPDVGLNPNPLSLPPDDELTEELCAHRYKVNSKGQIQIVSKDTIKQTLGRSPDKADAVMMACAPVALFKATPKQHAGTW